MCFLITDTIIMLDTLTPNILHVAIVMAIELLSICIHFYVLYF